MDEFGHVVAVAPGQAIITVSNGTYSALCVIAVEASSTEVKDFKLSMDHFSGLKPNGAHHRPGGGPAARRCGDLSESVAGI